MRGPRWRWLALGLGPLATLVLHRLGRVLHRLVERVLRVIRGLGPQHRGGGRGSGSVGEALSGPLALYFATLMVC